LTIPSEVLEPKRSAPEKFQSIDSKIASLQLQNQNMLEIIS